MPTALEYSNIFGGYKFGSLIRRKRQLLVCLGPLHMRLTITVACVMMNSMNCTQYQLCTVDFHQIILSGTHICSVATPPPPPILCGACTVTSSFRTL